MATWSSRGNLVRDPAEAEVFHQYNKKPCYKIDPIGKLQIIHALDNGQCKSDVAKEYGVHPQTIAYIYKQKEAIVKKYSQKYNSLIQARGMNLDQTLLDWFRLELKNGIVVHEDQLKSKAQDIINSLKEKFTCLDDWLSDFQIRHNIVKYISEIECSPQAKEEWMMFINILDVRDIYFGGFTALSYKLDFNSYINGHNADRYFSLLLIVNTTGIDKHQLAMAGNEPFEDGSQIRSLPLDYYYNVNPEFNFFILESYLKRWDEDLMAKGKHIYLIMNLPGSVINKLNLKNIKVISNANEDFITKVSEKVIGCFKYHYRRLQISRSVLQRDCLPTLLDYLYMIGTAWNNVSYRYIHRLCFPPNDGSLYFKMGDDDDYGNHSLADWCKANEIPIDTELCSDPLEKFVFCDNGLPCYNWANYGSTAFINEMLLQRNTPSTSAMEAFQAMKRLVSYLQGENASLHIIRYAKYLEDHLEYGALLQMHEIAAASAADTNEAM